MVSWSEVKALDNKSQKLSPEVCGGLPALASSHTYWIVSGWCLSFFSQKRENSLPMNLCQYGWSSTLNSLKISSTAF